MPRSPCFPPEPARTSAGRTGSRRTSTTPSAWRSRARRGRATFYYALAREFLVWRNTEVTVTLDDAERRGRMHDVLVANGEWHAGGMRVAPGAEPDDGLFQVILIGD